MVNSRLGLFSATTLCSIRMGLHNSGYPLSRSYGGILPSSLTSVLPRTLDSLPAYLCRFTVRAVALTRSFSRQCGSTTSARISAHSASRLRLSVHGFAYAPPYTLTHALPFACLPAFLCHPLLKQLLPVQEYQPVVHLLRLCLGLGPDLP